jgi:hypothetical protein
MSALGQKRTLFTVPFYVCFIPESGHLSACAGHSAMAESVKLRVEITGASITVTMPRTRYTVTHYKPDKSPLLAVRVRRIAETEPALEDRLDRRTTLVAKPGPRDPIEVCAALRVDLRNQPGRSCRGPLLSQCACPQHRSPPLPDRRQGGHNAPLWLAESDRATCR